MALANPRDSSALLVPFMMTTTLQLRCLLVFNLVTTCHRPRPDLARLLFTSALPARQIQIIYLPHHVRAAQLQVPISSAVHIDRAPILQTLALLDGRIMTTILPLLTQIALNLGTYDNNSNAGTTCSSCSTGSYSPKGQAGLCFQCLAGESDTDSTPTTP